jgi:hypothetical protein
VPNFHLMRKMQLLVKKPYQLGFLLFFLDANCLKSTASWFGNDWHGYVITL